MTDEYEFVLNVKRRRTMRELSLFVLNEKLKGRKWHTSCYAGPRGKSFFSAEFRELTDKRLGKEESAAADHMLLIGRTW
jgi:hypothetical protein